MPVANYPTPDQGGARYNIFEELPTDFSKAVLEYEMKDGTASYNQIASAGLRFFRFEYLWLSPSEQAIHDGHNSATFGNLLGFTLIRPRTGEVITNVHYKEYTYNRREIAWKFSRSVLLIKRP